NVPEILLTDGTNVSQGMDGQRTTGIPTGLAGLDIQAWKLKATHGKARHILIRHSQPDRNTVEASARANGPDELIELFSTYQVERDQAPQGIGQIRHFLRDQLELVRRGAGRNDFAVAIDNQAPGSGNRLGTNAVTLRQLHVIVVVYHLQHVQLDQQG